MLCPYGSVFTDQAFDGKYADRLGYVNPVFYSQLWSLLGRPVDKRTPSTGLLAIALALGMCDTVSIYGFGKAGQDSKGTCRHYWSCAGEDEAAYYDPLHTFHDWLAEERLRDLWVRAGIVLDGSVAYGGGLEAVAKVTHLSTASAVPCINIYIYICMYV